MSIKVLESNNYGKFELTEQNRDVKNTAALEASMKKHGWIDAYPAHVIRNGGNKLLIKAGHHRFVVAQKLGIPVKYVECQDDATIVELERGSRKWSARDYLDSFVREGKAAYITLLDYHVRTGIPLPACISLLTGKSAVSGNKLATYKAGTYKIGNLSHSRVVESIIMQSFASGFPYWNHTPFVHAVSKVCWAAGFSSEVLKEKIKTFAYLMRKQNSRQDYLEMIDSIYNRQSHIKIPLAFLAEEAARKRNAVKK